jgi:hypothetical protein
VEQPDKSDEALSKRATLIVKARGYGAVESDRGQILYFMLKHALRVMEEVAQRVVN